MLLPYHLVSSLPHSFTHYPSGRYVLHTGREEQLPGLTKCECIAKSEFSLFSGFPQCLPERFPLQPQPIPSFFGIEMFRCSCSSAQPELRLNTVKQFVD